ncbi:hypothetical protein SNEBB_005778 [Seison nebaliae]|nr:hypothetical protein SNEBB_005778 [Seison nebaliae]
MLANAEIKDFEKTRKFDDGTFSAIYHGENRMNGLKVSLKRVVIDEEGVPPVTIREIALLKQLDHQNIIKLFTVVTNKNKIYLVLELIKMNLHEYITQVREDPNLPFNVVNLMYQLTSALHHCHVRRIIHRDVKPKNIKFLNGIVKLSDFELARSLSFPIRVYSQDLDNQWYCAPEILLGSTRYGPGIDIWSLGCIMGEMYLFLPLFPADSEIGQLLKIFYVLSTPKKENYPNDDKLSACFCAFPNWTTNRLKRKIPQISDEGLDLLQRTLEYCPKNRISAGEMLKHSYFKHFSELTDKSL